MENEFSYSDFIPGYGHAGAEHQHHRKSSGKGLLSIEAVNIRDYTENKHGKVDDYLMEAVPAC